MVFDTQTGELTFNVVTRDHSLRVISVQMVKEFLVEVRQFTLGSLEMADVFTYAILNSRW